MSLNTLLMTSLIALAAIAALAVFAVNYRPQSYAKFWVDLANSFKTDRLATQYPYKNQWLYVRTNFRTWAIDTYFVGEYTRFDMNLDSVGLWLLYEGPMPQKCPESMFIPWDKIKFVKHHRTNSYFTFMAAKPVKVLVHRPIGEAMIRCLVNY